MVQSRTGEKLCRRCSKTMMMNTSCIHCTDMQNPVKISKASVKHRQWAESDARFLRMISRGSQDEAVIGDVPVVDGYACRQRFLRSYRFSRKKETVAQRTKKCLRTVARRTKKWLRAKWGTAVDPTSKEDKGEKKRSNGDGSCSFLEAVFNFLLLCVAKVVLRLRPAEA